jgi:hypothetical protein
MRKSCAGVNMLYSREKRVFILKHYFTLKSFAAVREAFSNMNRDKEMLNMSTIHANWRRNFQKVVIIFVICCKAVQVLSKKQKLVKESYVNNELERMWKEAVVAQFKALSWHLHGD